MSHVRMSWRNIQTLDPSFRMPVITSSSAASGGGTTTPRGAASAGSTALRYVVPNDDFCSYLKGFWKRNLEWRHFGASFKHLRSTNNVVLIEEDEDAARQPNTQFLKWSFGRTHKRQDLVSAYTIQFIPDEQGTFMEWSFEGVTCHGVFKPEASVAIFNFCLQESMVTITYRVLDPNTMAVCIVDVDSEHTPTIQYGNMYRIDPSKYDNVMDEV